MHIDRRRSPRIELVGQLHATSASREQPVDVREISLGGMAIETAAPFEVGTIHMFRLTLGNDSTVELTGRVMRSRPSESPDSPSRYVTGIQFIDDEPPEGAVAVEKIIDRVR